MSVGKSSYSSAHPYTIQRTGRIEIQPSTTPLDSKVSNVASSHLPSVDVSSSSTEKAKAPPTPALMSEEEENIHRFLNNSRTLINELQALTTTVCQSANAELSSIVTTLNSAKIRLYKEDAIIASLMRDLIKIANSIKPNSKEIDKSQLNKMKIVISTANTLLELAYELETCSHNCSKLINKTSLIKEKHSEQLGIWERTSAHQTHLIEELQELIVQTKNHMQALVRKYESSPKTLDIATTTSKLESELTRANQTTKLSSKSLKVDFDQSSVGIVTMKDDKIGKSVQVGSYKAGWTSLQNYKYAHKTPNEDRMVASEIKVGKIKIPFFAVYDGHGGSETSQYVSEKLHKFIEKELALAMGNSKDLGDEKIFKAIKKAFISCNEALRLSGKAGSAGSTASIAMIINDHVWVANAGDSRILLSDPNQEVVALSDDASPDTQEDRFAKTALSRGGSIIDRSGILRIQGGDGKNPATFRAFGDFYALGITASPKIIKYPLNEISPGTKLIVGCDGVFDAASSSEIHAFIKKATQKKMDNPTISAQIALKARHAVSTGTEPPMTQQALKNKDDITVIVIDLKPKT